MRDRLWQRSAGRRGPLGRSAWRWGGLRLSGVAGDGSVCLDYLHRYELMKTCYLHACSAPLQSEHAVWNPRLYMSNIFFYDLNLNLVLPSSEQYCACYESSLFVSPNMIDNLVSIAT